MHEPLSVSENTTEFIHFRTQNTWLAADMRKFSASTLFSVPHPNLLFLSHSS